MKKGNLRDRREDLPVIRLLLERDDVEADWKDMLSRTLPAVGCGERVRGCCEAVDRAGRRRGRLEGQQRSDPAVEGGYRGSRCDCNAETKLSLTDASTASVNSGPRSRRGPLPLP
jgi:hypothetical protein